MINLNLQLKQSEVTEFYKLVECIFNNTYKLLEACEYYHYYNVRSLVKKIIDKKFNSVTSYRKKIGIKININEFESLKFMYSLNPNILELPETLYYKVFLLDIMANFDKKIKNLPNNLLNSY